MNSIANMVTAGGILVVIVLAKGMHASPVVIGAMFSIGSVGGILGSLFGARIQKRVSFGAIVIACFGVQTLLFPLQAVAPNPVALGCIAAGLFSVGPVYNVALFSYRLSIVPDHLLGRVTSSVRLVATGTMPLGSALAGLLLQAVGPRPTVLIFSACLLFVAVVSILNSQVRHAPQISEMAAEEATAATR
jgi:predicted MFS family arabinose efflux permease